MDSTARDVTATFAPQYTISLSGATASATEGTDVVFPLTIDDDLTDSITVVYDITAGTSNPVDSADLTLAAGQTTTFASGTTTLEIPVPTIGDSTVEPNETFTITLTGISDGKGVLGSTTSATGTITNDDSAVVSLAASSDTSATEGSPASDTAQFLVNLSSPSSTPTDVNLTLGGSAGSGDYSLSVGGTALTGGTVTIPANTSSLTVDVIANTDNLVEGAETLDVSLTSTAVTAGNAGISADATSTASVTINEGDAATVSISAVTSSTNEGDTLSPGQFRIQLDTPSVSDTVIDLDKTGSTAQPADYDLFYTDDTSVGTSVTIPKNETSVLIDVESNADTTVEDDETVTLTITVSSGPLTTGTADNATVTILDNDSGILSLTAVDAAAAEGDSTDPGQFRLSLNHPSSKSLTVSFDTTGSTAESGDYALAVGGAPLTGTSITVPPNTSEVLIDVTCPEDSVVEGAEDLVLNLTDVTGDPKVDISTSSDSATVVISDNDPFTLSLTGDSQVEGTALTFTVELGGNLELSAPLSVSYNVNDGTATTADSDYTDTTGTVSFAANATNGSTQSFTVSTTADGKVESDETLAGEVSTGHGNFTATGSTLTATGTIENDDSATVSLSGDADAVEGGATGTFTLTMSAVSDSDTTVTFALDAVSVAGSSDYSLADGTGPVTTSVVIPADAGTASLTVTAIDDSLVEETEALVLTLSNTDNGNVTIGTATDAVNLTDNDAFTLTVTGDSQTEGTALTFTVELGGNLELGAPVSVTYNVNDGTATTADNDYTDTTGTLSFAADAADGSTQSFTVSTTADGKVESDETLVGQVSTGHGSFTATGSTLTATGTIQNDDSATVSLSGDADAVEGGATGTFTLTMSAVSDSDTTVTFALDAASVAGSSDYSLDDGTGPVTTSVVIPADAGTATLTVTATDDSLVEETEALVLALSNTDNGNVTIGTATDAVNLTDNDAFTLTVTGDSQVEGTALTFTVTLGGDLELGAPVSVTYNVNDGTATTADSDYTDTTGTLSFAADAPAGSTQSFTVSTTVDGRVESDETLAGQVSTGHGSFTATGSTLTADGTIENDDSATVSLSGDADAVEGGATGAFTLTMSAVSDTDTTVTFALDAASVAGSSDYSLADGTDPVTTSVVIPADAGTASLTVTATDDSLVEETEALVLKLVGTDNVSIATDTTAAAINLTDDDSAAVSIEASDSTAAEPADGGQFTVTLSNPSSSATTVAYQVTGTATPGDTLTPGSDFAALSGSVSIPAGSTSAAIDVTVIDDTRVEASETVIVTLDSLSGDPQITIHATDNEDTVSIGDDDSYRVYFAAADQSPSITEGDADHDVAFTVSLDAAGDLPVTVGVSAAGLNDGVHVPAVPGSDFALGASSVTIAAGATSATIPVTIKGDTVVEDDDSFVITLDSVTSGPGAVDTNNDEAIGTIVNDDAYTLSVNSVDVAEGDSGTTTASFTVSVDLIGAQPVEVAYTVADGSATSGADYAMADGSVTIPANTAGETIAFTVNGDTDIEGNEDFTVTLGAVTGPGAAATDGSQIGTATIKDDDGYRIVVADAGNVTEGDTASFTVSLVPLVGGAHSVSIDYATEDGSALAGSDYTAVSGSLSFNNGNSSRTVDVATIDNTSDDGSRSFKLVLDETTMTGSFAGIAYVGDGEGSCTIVDDEYVVAFEVNGSYGWIDGTTPQVVTHGGSTSEVEAMPIDDEYYFSGWTGDYVGDYTQKKLTITGVVGDMSVYANFKDKPVLTPSLLPFSAEDSAPHGEILPTTPQVVDFNSDFTFSIEPEAGYCVDYVEVDNVNQGYHEDYTFFGVTADHTIEAHFRDRYQVRGAVAPETARGNAATWSVTGTHLDGTTFSAGPLPHFEPVSIPCGVLSVTVTFSDITGWQTPAPQTINLTGDTIVTGHYQPQVVVNSDYGKVTSSDAVFDCGSGGTACSAYYPYGTKIMLEAASETGYVFGYWSGSIAGAAPKTSFYVKEPMSITANYESQTGTNVDLDGDGWTEDDGDCAPNDGTIYPGAPEVCSGTGTNIDHDCDGLTAETLPSDPDCDDTTVGISNLPLDTLLQAAPANIMVVVDDSISMDWEFSCAEGEEGKYEGDYWYFMPDPEGDNESNNNELPTGKRADWRIQWHDYNRMYYDPQVEYRPWPSATGDGSRMPNAHPNCPKSDPMVEDTDYCLDMDSDFFSLGDNTTEDNVGANGIVVDSHDANGGGFTLEWKDIDTDDWTMVSLSSPSPWREDDDHNEGYGENFYDSDNGNLLKNDYVQATWTPPSTVASDQYYNVYAWWRDIGGYSQDTKYYIYHEGGTQKAGPFEMNQQNNSETWNRLGDKAYRGITKVTIEDYIDGNSDHVCADAVSFVPAADPSAATLSTVPVAHYYVVVSQDADGDGHPDVDSLGLPVPDRVILVVMDSVDQRVEYWETFFDSDNYVTGFSALDPTDPAQVPDSAKPPQREWIYTYASTGTPTGLEQYEAERQNFANWYSYYRRRELTAKAAIGELFDDLRGVRAGVHYLNNTNRSLNVRPIRVTEIDADTNKEIIKNDIETLLDNLYHYQSSGGTRLRETVLEVGEYFDQTDGKQPHEDLRTKNWDEYGLENPWATAAEGGECQQSFMIITTDGYYNNNVTDINNVDGQTPLEDFRLSTPDKYSRQLFADGYENTLSDFTMYFYQRDLSDTLANKVPVNDANHDFASHQHLVSYTVALGLRGYLNPEDYVLYSEEPSLLHYPEWQDPLEFGRWANTPRKIDDLWHAAVNGRGMYLSAEDPAKLTESLTEIMQNLVARIGSGSSLSINGEELTTNLVMYQASYSTDGWWGDVRAYPVSALDGKVDNDVYIWSAGEELGAGADWDTVSWDTDREIATYKPGDGTVNPAGVPFRWTSLTADQQALLSDDPTTGAVENDGLGETRLQYIRGSNANELRQGGALRDRYSKLGDIVHSAPFYQGYLRIMDADGDGTTEEVDYGAVFVSANDGMLHAFEAETGRELFAYVPNLVLGQLNRLSVAEPYFAHMYYVDMTPYVKEVGGSSGSEKLLVGGLGKGGKGYFSLDVTEPWNNTESNADQWVLWEYPHTDSTAAEKDNMGYSFSEAFIVQSYWTDAADTTNHWITVFGNGYASTSGTAALYVLNAKTGALLKMIDTGTIGNNGMSTPTPVDVNGDYTVDFVYAGDLQGNVWKFDLRDSDPANWRSFYYKDDGSVAGQYDAADTPQPLFRARGREKDSLGDYTIPSVIYGQPITTKLSIIKHCDNDAGGYMVLFGTGRYLSTLDVSDTRYQTIYGIWDYGDEPDEHLGAFSRGATVELSSQADTVSLLEQEVVQWAEYGGKWLRVLSDYVPDWTKSGDDPANHAGWYLDLPLDKERIIRNSTVRDGKLIILSSIPSDDPCDAGGDSIVHEINACTGGRLETPQFDLNNDGMIDENDLVALLDASGNPMTDAHGDPIMVPPSGVKFDTMMYPPIILLTPGGITERKYFSTAAGSIQTMEETAERRGVYYWRMR